MRCDYDDESTDRVLLRLVSFVSNFSCRYWDHAIVISPEDHLVKARHEFEQNPSPTAERRLQQAYGYAVVMYGPKAPDWRGELPGSRALEAMARLTPEGAETMSEREVHKLLIGTILLRECHEILESGQAVNKPGMPVIDPHHASDDLTEMVNRVADALLDHA